MRTTGDAQCLSSADNWEVPSPLLTPAALLPTPAAISVPSSGVFFGKNCGVKS